MAPRRLIESRVGFLQVPQSCRFTTRHRLILPEPDAILVIRYASAHILAVHTAPRTLVLRDIHTVHHQLTGGSGELRLRHPLGSCELALAHGNPTGADYG